MSSLDSVALCRNLTPNCDVISGLCRTVQKLNTKLQYDLWTLAALCRNYTLSRSIILGLGRSMQKLYTRLQCDLWTLSHCADRNSADCNDKTMTVKSHFVNQNSRATNALSDK